MDGPSSVTSSDIYLCKMEQDVVMLTRIYSISHMLSTKYARRKANGQKKFFNFKGI